MILLPLVWTLWSIFQFLKMLQSFVEVSSLGLLFVKVAKFNI